MHTDAVQQSQFVYLNGCSTPLLSRLAYATAEPFTVSLSFRVEPGEWIDWEFARDLLITGLDEPVGDGDIRVRPDLAVDADILVLELESPDGYGVAEFHRDDVRRFVEATRDLVEQGEESDHLDIDAVIADLTTAKPGRE